MSCHVMSLFFPKTLITITYYNSFDDVLFLLFSLTFLNCLENMGSREN